jgi:methyl-accepting chemotaxis protein
MDEQSTGSQQIATALHTMNNSTMEVRTASAEMTEGNKLILHEIQKIQVAADQMDENMNYMNNESQKILEKAQNLSDINELMEGTIRDIAVRIEQFKV